jgi:hypothetical protein
MNFFEKKKFLIFLIFSDFQKDVFSDVSKDLMIITRVHIPMSCSILIIVKVKDKDSKKMIKFNLDSIDYI